MRLSALVILASSPLLALAAPSPDIKSPAARSTDVAASTQHLDERGLLNIIFGGGASGSSSFSLSTSMCTSAFSAALDARLNACSLSLVHRALLRSSAMFRLNTCGANTTGAYAAAGASILGAVDVSIKANTHILGQIGASISAVESFATSLNAKISGAAKLSLDIQTSLAQKALEAVFAAKSVEDQIGACAGVLGQVQASISAGSGALIGGSVAGSIDVYVSTGFLAALDGRINGCSLSAEAKAALRASAVASLNGCGKVEFGAQASFAAGVLAAVDASIKGNTGALGSVSATVDGIAEFAASLKGQLTVGGKLSAEAQASLAAKAFGAVFGAGPASAQTSACAGVLAQVGASVSAGKDILVDIAVIGSIDTFVSAGFAAALDARINGCSLSADAKAALRISAIASLNACGKTEFGAQASFAAGVLAAVDASIKANTGILGSVSASVNGIAEFAASLKAKISVNGALSAEAQAHLAASAFGAVFGAGSAQAQTSACAGVLAQVTSSVSAGRDTLVNVTVVGSINAGVAAGFMAALEARIGACSLSAQAKAQLQAIAIAKLNGCGIYEFGAQASFAAGVLAAVDLSIKANTSTLGSISASVDGIAAFAASLKDQLSAGGKLSMDAQASLAAKAFAAVFGAGSASAQTSACAGVLAQVGASISTGATTLVSSTATATVSVGASASASATGHSMPGMTQPAAMVYVNVTLGFTTAIDMMLSKCSLSTSDKSALRADAFKQLYDCSEMSFPEHAAYGATIIAAVADAIAAGKASLPVLTATVDAVQTFAATLFDKITKCSLSADDKVKLTGAALAAVYEAGSVKAQAEICGSVLAQVDVSISTNVAVLGGVKGSATVSAGGSATATGSASGSGSEMGSGPVEASIVAAFTAALDTKISTCGLSAELKAALAAAALAQLKGCAGLHVDAQAGFAAAIFVAVDAAIAAKTSALATVTVGLDAIAAFHASLTVKIGAAVKLAADVRASLLANALAAVYISGSASAQASACAGVLGKVDTSLAAGVSVIAGAGVAVSSALTGIIGAALGTLLSGTVGVGAHAGGCTCH